MDPSSVLHAPPVVEQATLQALGAVSVQPNESFPSICPPKPEFQHLVTAHISRHVSHAGKGSNVGKTISAGFSLSFQDFRAAPALCSQASEAPYLSQQTSHPVKEVPRVRNLCFFTALPQEHRFHPDSSSSPFFFVLPSYVGIFLSALLILDLLQAFSR